MSYAARHIISIDDLGAEGIQEVLNQAEDFRERDYRYAGSQRATATLLFLESSTRTFAGFSGACLRLGVGPIPLHELRFGEKMDC